MIYHATLTKVSTNENALRTPSVEGWFTKLPKIGDSFIIYADAITEGVIGVRIVGTSLVVRIDGEEFQTENSVYRLEKLREL